VDAEVRRLLVERLHCLAKDHQHARAMIDRWLETRTAAPKVADLVSLASETRTAQALPAGCASCGGEYWVVGPNGATRCNCARGSALRQLEQRAARESQKAAPWRRVVVSDGPRPAMR